uniref:zinc finger protein 25-like n=1 Tax=Jaculus jaculus TaxID=51337 RepID=UPI001E1B5DD0|nr:zinc finger protein 25-like [Jaculus jaculus]
MGNLVLRSGCRRGRCSFPSPDSRRTAERAAVPAQGRDRTPGFRSQPGPHPTVRGLRALGGGDRVADPVDSECSGSPRRPPNSGPPQLRTPPHAPRAVVTDRPSPTSSSQVSVRTRGWAEKCRPIDAVALCGEPPAASRFFSGPRRLSPALCALRRGAAWRSTSGRWMSGKPEMGSVSFEDIAVDFTRQEWQELGADQRTLYRDVMLENYNSLVFLGYCITKPELIFKLEHGGGPWHVAEASVRNLPVTGQVGTNQENQKRHLWQVQKNSTNEEIVKNEQKVHLKIYQGIKCYEGKACVRMCNQESQYQRNLMSYTCKKALYYNSALNKHHNLCRKGGKKDEYKECRKTLKSLHIVPQRTHLSKKHNEYTEYGESLYYKKVSRHRSHSGEKRYECRECGKAYTSKAYLTVHERTHTGEKPYECTECTKAFIRKVYLTRHQRTHVGDKPYECTQCTKAFTRKEHLARHQRTHTGEKPYLCTECGKAFCYKEQLIVHKSIHSGEKPYECTECGKVYTNKVSLTRHERIHTGEKPYKCTECGKFYIFKGSLIQHQRAHTGEKPYECIDCGKAFTRKGDLTHHQTTHTGEKPYECTECGKAFTRKGDLRKHQRTHTGEKPYECTECGKAFTCKAELIRHQRTHTGEKPYECTECGKAFTRKVHLTHHQKSHMGEKCYSFPKYTKVCTRIGNLTHHHRTHAVRSSLNVENVANLSMTSHNSLNIREVIQVRSTLNVHNVEGFHLESHQHCS